MIVTPFTFLASTDPTDYPLLGSGTGTYGQETRLLGTTVDVKEWLPEAALPIADSGLLKLTFELGFFGVIAFLLLQAAIFSNLRFIKRIQRDHLFFAALMACIMWFVFFLKVHSTLSDQMVNAFYWFYVGILIHRARKIRRPIRT